MKTVSEACGQRSSELDGSSTATPSISRSTLTASGQVYSPLPPGYDRNLDPAYARACLSKFGFDETDEDRMVLARVRQHDKRVLAEERRVKREQRAAKRQAKKGL